MRVTWLHWIAQLGSILAVTLDVNQHERNPLVVLNDVRNAGEILLPFLLFSQSVLLSRLYEADWNVVHFAVVKHS